MTSQWNHHIVHSLSMKYHHIVHSSMWSSCMSKQAMYSPCSHLCTTQKHFVNICEHQSNCYWWIHVGKMLRLHLECEQNVSGRNRWSKLHLIPQCSYHVITCFQRPSPPVILDVFKGRIETRIFSDKVRSVVSVGEGNVRAVVVGHWWD